VNTLRFHSILAQTLPPCWPSLQRPTELPNAKEPTVGPKKPPTTSALDQTSWYNLKATARPKLITASVPVRFRTPLSRYGCLQNFDGWQRCRQQCACAICESSPYRSLMASGRERYPRRVRRKYTTKATAGNAV